MVVPAMTPFVQDADFTLLNCDVMDGLRSLTDESVHCCVTSPPYWGLRSYGVDNQLGLEATPELFVAAMVDVFREVRRVLRADGTLWLNLGDSYVSNGFFPDAPSNQNESKSRSHARGDRGPQITKAPGLKPKDLCGIPWRVAFALQADGWYLRSDIIWAKPNPMPESVTDRPTKAHEYLFLLSKSPRYYWDAEALREEAEWARWGDQTNGKHEGSGSAAGWIGAKPKAALTANSTRGTNSTTPSCPTLRPEVAAAFRTDDGALNTRGWCDLGESKLAVALPVASQAERLQILEPVGFEVGVETAEGDLVMHLEPAGNSTPKTDISVAVSRSAALLGPVWAAIVDAAASPSGAVLTTPGVLAEPSSAALARAEVVGLELASVSPEAGAALVTLQLEEVGASLLVWGSFGSSHLRNTNTPSGRNCRSVWTIPTQPYPEAHFATFPEALPERCIKAGTSERGCCPECGAPWVRQTDVSYTKEGAKSATVRGDMATDRSSGSPMPGRSDGAVAAPGPQAMKHGRANKVVQTTGWAPSCECAQPGTAKYPYPLPPVPCTVLDPFMGSGTTALVARRHGRRSIGIELSPEYADLCAKRLAQQSLFAGDAA